MCAPAGARPAGAVLDREGAGDAERIEAVQVAAGRQDRRRAQQVATRRRAHVAAVERAQDAGDLMVLAIRASSGQFAQQLDDAGRAAGAALASSADPGVARDQRLDAGARRPRRARPRPGQQQVDPLRGAGRLADHVQAVRDQRVFEFEHRLRPRPGLRRCAVGVVGAPGRLGARGRARRPAPGSSRPVVALGWASGPGAPALDRGLQVDQARYRPAWATGGVR
jgi:hypothetical protein